MSAITYRASNKSRGGPKQGQGAAIRRVLFFASEKAAWPACHLPTRRFLRHP
jgi:hypothetical protein